MDEIERVAGFVPTRSWGSAFKDLVWAIGMSDDLTLSLLKAAKTYNDKD